MIKGIDTSHHNGDKGLIDWKKVKEAGYVFAFLKATQGTSFKDWQYLRDRKEARAAGVVVGHYHFAGDDLGVAKNPIDEADFFLSVVGDLQADEPLMLDWEIELDNAPAWCLAFLSRIEEKTGVKPLLYTNEARVLKLDWSVVVEADFGLWVAKYGVNDGKMNAEPKAGKWPFVAIWQYTSVGTVPGIIGNVDVDAAYMTLETLKRYGRTGGATTTPKTSQDAKFHRYGHLQSISVKLGDTVKAGQKIGENGTGNGQWPAHLHYDIPLKKLAAWTKYVFGMTKEQVAAAYGNPEPYRKIVAPWFDHFGWQYLQLADYSGKTCYHPGEDLNGVGAGNADLGMTVYSATDGVVVHCDDVTTSNGGWGKLLVIQEVTSNQEAEPMITKELQTAIEKVVGKDYGDTFSESEQKKAAELVTLACEDANTAVRKSVETIDQLHQENKGLESKVAELEKQLTGKQGVDSLSTLDLFREILNRITRQ